MKRKRVVLNVSKEDVLNGKPCASNCCPIALAIIRRFPDARNVVVSMSQASFSQGSTTWVAALSDSARDFVKSYDTSVYAIKPYRFVLSFYGV